MYQRQSSLPELKPNKNPKFTQLKPAEVTGNKDFADKGVIYARFTKGGTPCPVNVYEYGVRTMPEEGDMIIVGFLEGDKTTPYFAGFAMDMYACANYISVQKDSIDLQLPLDSADRDEHMTDDTKVSLRAAVRMYDGALELYYPKGDGTGTSVKLTDSSVDIEPATGVIVNIGGSTPVARQGDTVEIVVGGITYIGTITGGSAKVNVG